MTTQPTTTEPYVPNERKTPGHVAFEAAVFSFLIPVLEWHELTAEQREQWESVAFAVRQHQNDNFKP